MKLTLIFSFLLLSLTSFSQDKVLPMDETGKYTFLEIVALKSVPKEVISTNAKRFFNANSKSVKLKTIEQDTVFFGKGKLIIQKGLAGIGHQSGEVTYDLSISLRSDKYRVILTNYVVTPYGRDRYGNFIPVAVGAPLEKPPGKLNRSEWENNMEAIVNESKKIAEKLKIMMTNTLAEPKSEIKQPAAISTTKW